MLRKILLGLTLFTVLVSCKEVDPELPAEVNFKSKITFLVVGQNDTAYVKITGDSKANIVKFVPCDTHSISIIQEGKDFVVYKQKKPGSAYFITAGLINFGQLKSQDTLWLKATGTGIDASKGNIAFIYSPGLYLSGNLTTVNPATLATTSISTSNISSPVSPCWTPDRKGILVNDYYGGFYIYALNGTVLSSNSSYSGSSSHNNSRFSLDGKAIYGYNTTGVYYVKDYNSKENIILPISAPNNRIYAIAIGSLNDNIAYVTYADSHYMLYHYKNGVSTLIESGYDRFNDLAVSPNGQYVAYVVDNRLLKLYDRASPPSSRSYTIDYFNYNGYNLRSPCFNPSNDQITYSVQSGMLSGTSSYESVVAYGIRTHTYNMLAYGKQPSW